MNIAYLRYVSEVQKSGSITKAAQNLYMGQPNLSKAIKELEKEIGITIFRRTSKGVETTRRGEEFLAYANTILSQIDELESLYQLKTERAIQLSLSVPRASYISDLFAEFISHLDQKEHMDIQYRETSSMAAANDVSSGESDLGIIRYQLIYESYFLSYLKSLKLVAQPLREYTMQLLMSKDHPLAQLPEVNYHMLAGYTEIVHGDLQVPSLSFSDIAIGAELESPSRRIFVYERGSQFDFLLSVPGTYMWVSPMPKDVLDRFGLVTKECPLSRLSNRDVLIFRKGHQFSKLQNRFLAYIKEKCGR